MKKIHPIKVKNRNYIWIMVLSIGMVLLVGNLVNKIVDRFYSEIVQKDAVQIADQYVTTVENALSASTIINTLLEDKIKAVTRMVAQYDVPLSDKLLQEIAVSNSVDEIYSYDEQGTIVYSASGKYIGWTAYEGHPVMDFIESGATSYVEDIRRDTESQNYYKYGYYKRTDGTIVQIGIKADVVHEFLDSFQIENLIPSIEENSDVSNVFFMDVNNQMIAGSVADPTLINIPKAGKEAISDGQRYLRQVQIENQEVYQIMIPIYVDAKNLGTLVMCHSEVQMNAFALQIKGIIYVNLLIIAAVFGISILLIFKRNNRLAYQAYHDLLTNLPNKRYYDRYMESQLKENKEEHQVLMVIDYRNLDFINTIYGYHSTENIITDTGRRIQRLCNSRMQVFHISYDRFALYIYEFQDYTEINRIANDCLDIMKDYAYSNQIGGNVGIYEFDGLTGDASEILKYATIAANDIRKDERFLVNYFDKKVEQAIRREEKIEYELQRIIYNGTYSDCLYLEFQPMVDLITGKVAGFEALARLNTTSLGRIAPLEFIAVAEKTNLIVQLGEKVLYLATDFLTALSREGFADMNVAVNVSGIQLLKADFVTSVKRIIEETGISPKNLDLELTESVFANDFTYLNSVLVKLQDMNIDIYIDDFGTGYSSFQRGSDINGVTIKIDKIFIDKLETDEKRAVASDIIAMAHKLGHRVVAEGVESLKQLEYLKIHGCDFVQGYIYSKPLPFQDAIEYLYRFQPKEGD